jgi:hypothetical protein
MIPMRKRTASSEVYCQGSAIVGNLIPRFMGKHIMWWKDSCSFLVVDVFSVCRPALWPIAALSHATAYCLSPGSFSGKAQVLGLHRIVICETRIVALWLCGSVLFVSEVLSVLNPYVSMIQVSPCM